MSLSRVSNAQGCSVRTERETYSPACQLPSPRMASACTLVMRKRFSVSARLAESWASCDWSWAWRSRMAIRGSREHRREMEIY